MRSSVRNQDSEIYGKAYSDLLNFFKDNGEVTDSHRLLIDSYAEKIVALCKELRVKEGFSNISDVLTRANLKFQSIFIQRTKPKESNPSRQLYSLPPRYVSPEAAAAAKPYPKPVSLNSSADRLPSPPSVPPSPKRITRPLATSPGVPLRPMSLDLGLKSASRASSLYWQDDDAIGDQMQSAPVSEKGADADFEALASEASVDASVGTGAGVRLRRTRVPENIQRFNVRNNQMIDKYNTLFMDYFRNNNLPEDLFMIDFDTVFEPMYTELTTIYEDLFAKISISGKHGKESQQISDIFKSFDSFIEKCVGIYGILQHFIETKSPSTRYYERIRDRIGEIYNKREHYMMLNKLFLDDPGSIIQAYSDNLKILLDKLKIEKNIKRDISIEYNQYNTLKLAKTELEIKALKSNISFLKKKIGIEQDDFGEFLGDLHEIDFKFDFLHNFIYSQFYALDYTRFECDPDYALIRQTVKSAQREIRFKTAASHETMKFMDKYNRINSESEDSIYALISIEKDETFAKIYLKYYRKYISEGITENLLLRCEISVYGEINEYSPKQINDFVNNNLAKFRELSKSSSLDNANQYAYHYILNKIKNKGKEVDENLLKQNQLELISLKRKIPTLFFNFFNKINDENPEFFSSTMIDRLREIIDFIDFFDLIKNVMANSYKIFFTSKIDIYRPIVNRLYYEKDMIDRKNVSNKLEELIHLIILYGMLDLSFNPMNRVYKDEYRYILVDLNNIIGYNPEGRWNNKSLISDIVKRVDKNRSKIIELIDNTRDVDIFNVALLESKSLITSDLLNHSKRSVFYPIIYMYIKNILKFPGISDTEKVIIMVDSSKNSQPEGRTNIFTNYLSHVFTVNTPGVLDSIHKENIQYDVKSIGYLIYLSKILTNSFILYHGIYGYYNGIDARKINEI